MLHSLVIHLDIQIIYVNRRLPTVYVKNVTKALKKKGSKNNKYVKLNATKKEKQN